MIGQPSSERWEGTTTCQWFVRCVRKATGTLAHPILGDVPICDRCRRLAEEESESP